MSEREILEVVPKRVDIVVKRRTDDTFTFTLTDAEGTAIDITADTIEMRIFDAPGGTQLGSTKSNASGAHSSPGVGQTQFTVARTEIDDEVSSTDATLYWYDVRRKVGGNGAELVYFEGDFLVMPVTS